MDRLSARDTDITQQYDRIFELKSNLDAEHAQMQSRLTAQVTELTSSLSMYKERLESKERVEAKARADLQQASKLNDEVRYGLRQMVLFFLYNHGKHELKSIWNVLAEYRL